MYGVEQGCAKIDIPRTFPSLSPPVSPPPLSPSPVSPPHPLLFPSSTPPIQPSKQSFLGMPSSRSNNLKPISTPKLSLPYSFPILLSTYFYLSLSSSQLSKLYLSLSLSVSLSPSISLFLFLRFKLHE